MKETDFQFSEVYHLVDSSTVLGYVQKESGNFPPYEGIRVAEIQSSNVLEDGKLKNFAWVAGDDNPADWTTKPRSVKDLINLLVSRFWWYGPKFLTLPYAEWPIKLTYKKEDLEGELKVPNGVFSVALDVVATLVNRLINRYSI
jgi:hypothetical protein